MLKVWNRLRIFLWILIGLLGCSTSPSFRPSYPLKAAQGMPEGLFLCHEYDPPEPARLPVALKPFLDCVNEVADRYPLQLQGSALVFHRELNLWYRLLRPEEWNPVFAQEVETAVRALLRTLWRDQQRLQDSYTSTEKSLVLRHFPRTANSMNAQAWRESDRVSLDFELERLKAGIASLENRALGHQKLKSEVDYLSALWKDQRDMLDIAPQSSIPTALRERYRRRLKAAAEQLEFQKAQQENPNA